MISLVKQGFGIEGRIWMSGWGDSLVTMAGAFAAALAVGAIMSFQKRRAPDETDTSGGRIAPSNFLVWLAIGACSLMVVVVAIGIIYSIHTKDVAAGAILLLLFLFFAPGIILMWPWRSSDFDVVWTEENITGPSATWGPTLKRGPRTTISWEEISSLGMTKASFWFVEARDGQRIYWSYIYNGYPELFKTIVKHRPELDRKAVKNSRWDQ